MRFFCLVTLGLAVTMLGACRSGAKRPVPPVAKVVAHRLEAHGEMRVDPYYWLRERENPEVIAYLEAENRHTRAVMAHTEGLQEKLFEEIKGRIKQSDASVPVNRDGYDYYTRFEEGKQYAIYCRKKGVVDAVEEVMLDANRLAEGYEFFSVRGDMVTRDGRILAYAYDTVGRRFYTIRFKDLLAGKTLAEMIPDVTGNMVWANDNRTLFYAKQDPVTLRSFQIYRHQLGTDPAADALVYEEADDTFSVSVSRTKSRQFILIASRQTLSTEYRYISSDQPLGGLNLFQARTPNLEYSVDHSVDAGDDQGGGTFFVRTNWDAPNFRLMKTSEEATGKEHWRDVIGHRRAVFLAGFELFKDYLVLQERSEGLDRIRVRRWDGTAEHLLDFGEPTYSAGLGANPQYDTTLLRYRYTSLATPNSTYNYDMETREKALLKRDEVLGGFSSSDYVTERMWATARDGVGVPISLVRRRDVARDGTAPLLLYGYGSYGFSMSARFDAALISLLDRGFMYAIAHVRGGQEMGRHWYEDGKLLKKKNTFTDFIDCAGHLIDEGYTSADRLFAMGGSAGGLLMGAVANMAPELFNGMVARVPWVDVVTTMLDDSIPLTTSEYDEWGNPNDKVYYDYMLSYSPYDQVTAQAYPSMLVTTGLHDSQVQYWEPAKWVAKLRATKTDDKVLLLKTDMGAGHGGPTGRYRRYHETAFIYAFLLDRLEATPSGP